MDTEVDEPCLEGSDDELDMRLSDDGERIVYTSMIITNTIH